MAFRTWGRLLLTALGVSVLAGAGQLGVAYGFGIVRLTGAFTGTTVNQWPTQLVWVGWFAANAAVAGAVLTGRLARRDAPAVSTGRQLAIGGAAALGATVIAPLCMQPARAAELISVDPVWAVGICAVLGAVIGAGAAIAVLLRPELGWNMAAVAGAVWLLALISVLPSLGTTGPLPTVRLGVLEPSWLADDAAQRLSLLLLPIVALLAGVATAGLARWRGQAPLISGATGVAGPVLVAFAYLTAGPGDAVDRYQATPYYGSLIAILAGALGAAAAALLRWPVSARNADPQAIEPSDILRPLPPGPALPGAASANSTNDPATTNRTDAEPTADAKPAGGVVAGPWAAAGSDGVRTAPAHWDWPASTTGGQDGPTPAVPAKPAAWLTDPTGEFTSGAQTRRSIPDDVTSPARTERSAATSVSSPTDATPASAKAGRAGATTPTAGPAGDPTNDATSAGATSTGALSTGAASTGAASTGALSTGASTGEADAGTGDAAAPIKPRRVRKPKVSPAAAISDSGDDTSSSESDIADEAATGRARKVTRTGRSADSTGSGTTTDTPAQSRESQDTGSDRTTTETAPTAATGSTAAAPATATGATAAAPTAVTGSTGAPAVAKAESVNPPRTRAATAGTEAANPTAEAVPSSRVPAAAPSPKAGAPSPKAGTASPKTEAADRDAEATRPPRAPAAASSAEVKAADLPRGEAAAISSKAEATNPPRTPAAATSSKAKKADPTGASATEPAGGADEHLTSPHPATDDAPAATEDGPNAGLFGSAAASDPDTDRWTPAPSAWPVSAAWTVPPQATAPGPATSETPVGSDKPTGPTPRPRHRAPLPDLSRASTWNAFDTTRRAEQAESTDSSAARTTPTSPAAAGETAARPGSPRRTDAPVVPGTDGTPSDAASASATATGTDASTGTSTDESASTDATPAASKPGKVAEQSSRRGRLGGLFRRNRSRADEENQESADDVEPLPAQDEEFVDWVAGLSKPVSDNEPEQENGRRSLRSTGRHHRE